MTHAELKKAYDKLLTDHIQNIGTLRRAEKLNASKNGDIKKLVEENGQIVEENDALTAKIERLTDFCDYLTDKLADGATRSVAVEKLNQIING